ncbi:hypothetical protein [Litoreibacter janthinus]|uniref:Lipoprotein n=1 Tax=Litoreibacter janthinus TaxID=670154 RepID=A0A1I6FTZ4_9RHOB|nr:hypothetical protein [Litoreibacter janthinus]SFR33425.1 hypothetical protein SAMN04488002_0322 [Litoreibacter janthinus]
MRAVLLFCLTTLTACGAPSVGLKGGRNGTSQVGVYAFRVNYNDTRAEAYRTNIMRRPDARNVFAAGATAIEQVTGCSVVRSSVTGDVALVQADILC